MASLVSAGVSVTVTNESFFIPAAASTVPLFFIATADEKLQPDNITPAAGTYEYNVVRTVTSLTQSTQLYGMPKFLVDANGSPQHGDARNEYGVFALNQFLGRGNLAYVVRANINLDDNLTNLRAVWNNVMSSATGAAAVLENIATSYIAEWNATNNVTAGTPNKTIRALGTINGGALYTPTLGTYTYNNVPLTGGSGTGATANITVTNGAVSAVTIVYGGTAYAPGDVLSASSAHIGGTGASFTVNVATVISYKKTISEAELIMLATTATQPVWNMSSFQNLSADFLNDHTLAPYPVYNGVNGYNGPASINPFLGLAGIAAAWVSAGSGSVVTTEWLPSEAASTLINAADEFQYTTQFLNKTSLGSNDAARRANIVTALNAVINSNTDIRSETYEYNLILCPGYFETANAMLNLSIDILEEAMVIADTPFDKNPDDVVTWAATTARQMSKDVTYYYPHGLATNLDGNTVFCASSGVALATITYSDNVSELWFAPAGTQRGIVTVASDVGYVSGTLGTATTFVPVALNQGQRDNLYKYFTNINPIVFFPGRGLIVWGQKTSANAASAEDRINVERLIMYVRRQLRKNTMPFVFEPNDQLTRNNLKAAVDGFLGDLIVKRGLYDFVTVCDASNNTPDRIDRNELWCDIALKPVKAAEFIYIPIRIVATGANLTQG